jgi:hypothetical protein
LRNGIKLLFSKVPSNLFLFIVSIHFAFAFVFQIDVVFFYKISSITIPKNKDIIYILLLGFFVLLLQFFALSRNLVSPCIEIYVKKKNKKYLIVILLFSLVIAFAGNLLAVGLQKSFTLPFRLNGVIEVVCAFLLPVALKYLVKNKLLSFILIFVYSSFALVHFGSKYYALFPILVWICFEFLFSKKAEFKKNIALYLIAILLIPASYTVVNPFYFRSNLRSVDKVEIYALLESYKARKNAQEDLQRSFLFSTILGLNNLAGRLNGYETSYQTGVRVVKWGFSKNSNVHSRLNQYLNMPSGSASPGLYGHWIIFTNSLEFGMLFSCLSILTFFLFFRFFEKRISFLYVTTSVILLIQLYIGFMWFFIFFLKMILGVLFMHVFFDKKVTPHRGTSASTALFDK